MNPPDKQQSRSRKHFSKCLEQGTSNYELAGFWLATLGAAEGSSEGGEYENEITKCPAEYVVGLYSTFAEKFDKLLVDKLEYQTPTMLRQLLDSVDLGSHPVKNTGEKKWRRGVDLGCGTGLSGMAFNDIVENLIGVDLSEGMLERAKQRNIYKDLIIGDVTCVFASAEDCYDIVLACDVFVYVGDLSDIFDAVSTSLDPTGLFCFSTEYLECSPSEMRP